MNTPKNTIAVLVNYVGATGRTYWWAFVSFINARNKHHACAKARAAAPAHADKLRAFSR